MKLLMLACETREKDAEKTVNIGIIDGKLFVWCNFYAKIFCCLKKSNYFCCVILTQNKQWIR